jgi:argininosuccinate lyase
MEKIKKIWTGRIGNGTNAVAENFTCSLGIDRRLYLQDITGTAAYVVGLENIGVISGQERAGILASLKEIRDKLQSGKISFEGYEDIHSLIEFELEKTAGAISGKIHTGRSRNDQIVTDELLFLKSEILGASWLVLDLLNTLTDKAEKNLDLIFPAYTHMQKAQPVLVSHYLLSYYEKFLRSLKKLFENFESCDFLPLGSGACTGSGYPINRQLLAEILKFKNLASNSMDAVSSREYISDYIYTCSVLMQNLSRFCEDLIIFNSQEFSYVNITDSFCTGSSIMPQKKNPDILELIRGKSALVTGNLMQIMTLLKGLPLAYNSDMQEDKKILFSAADETSASIMMFTELLKNTGFNADSMLKSCGTGFIEATDAADYLVKKGMPFREAHKITGRIVADCIKNNLTLSEIKIEELKKYSELFEDDFYKSIDIKACINSKVTGCSTSYKSVKNNLQAAKKQTEELKIKLHNLQSRIPDFDDMISRFL